MSLFTLLCTTASYAKVNVVVSIIPQQTFVEKIGGDNVNVTTMVKPGSDPHSYEPKPSQMIAISKADIYFPIKIEFEHAWLDKFKDQNKKMQFVQMTKGVTFIDMPEHGNMEDEHDEHHHHHHGKNDPHTWVSPANVKIMAKNIYDALVQKDSSNADYYKKNYEKFLSQIDATDTKIKNILSNTPKNSKFMVFHPSWGYFAKEYGLTQIAIEVEGKEPKPKMLQKIIKKAKQDNIKAIFTQKEFSDKSAKVIASQLNIKVIKETPLAKDWSNNLIKIANAIANNN
jgi:zinc transport system substrate-binding protein